MDQWHLAGCSQPLLVPPQLPKADSKPSLRAEDFPGNRKRLGSLSGPLPIPAAFGPCPQLPSLSKSWPCTSQVLSFFLSFVSFLTSSSLPPPILSGTKDASHCSESLGDSSSPPFLFSLLSKVQVPVLLCPPTTDSCSFSLLGSPSVPETHITYFHPFIAPFYFY